VDESAQGDINVLPTLRATEVSKVMLIPKLAYFKFLLPHVLGVQEEYNRGALYIFRT
jgi:hypothetical protein